MQADNNIIDDNQIDIKLDQDSKDVQFEPNEKMYGSILLFAGAFAVSYLATPAAFARSGIILGTVSLIYSCYINYYSTCLIVKECRNNNIKSYYEYYRFLLGETFGDLTFIVFFFSAFLITVVTLISLNDLMSDFMGKFSNIQFLTNSRYCFWAIAVTAFSTPFVYKSTDESMMLISILTGLAIVMSLGVVIYTYYSDFESINSTDLKYFDLSGSVFAFDISYFSFILQLNIFDLFIMFKGDSNTKFNKIKKVSVFTNYLIFVPHFIVGSVICF